MAVRDVKALCLDVFVIILSFAVGCAMVVQANINIHLGYIVGNGIRASCISFWVGFLVCAAILLWGKRDRFDRGRLTFSSLKMSSNVSKLPKVRFYYSGGLFGAFYVTSVILCVPYVGYSLFFVCLVCGQLLSALLIDWRGLLETKRIRIHMGRVGGCFMTLLGSTMVFFSDSSGKKEDKSTSNMVILVCMTCALTSGFFLPTQAAVNNILRKRNNLSTTNTVAISLLVGALALSVMSALTYIWVPAEVSSSDNRWYYWFGGVIGVIYVAAGTQFSPIIGYSSFFISIISGQLVLSLLSDLYGLLGPVKPSADSALSLAGVSCAAIGALIVSIYKAVEASSTIETSVGISPLDEDSGVMHSPSLGADASVANPLTTHSVIFNEEDDDEDL